MSSINLSQKRRSSSTVNYKNNLVRSLSSQQHTAVNNSAIKTEPQYQPIYHHQPTIAYHNHPSSHLKAMRTSYNVQPIKKSIIINPPAGTEHIDINLEIRIKTPKRQRPIIPELFNRFTIKESPQQSQPIFTDTRQTLQYKINRQQPTPNNTERKRDFTTELSETRVSEARQRFSRIKCSVCNNVVPANQIDQHYEQHERMFKIDQNEQNIKSLYVGPENIRPFENRNESPCARKPDVSHNISANKNETRRQIADYKQEKSLITHKETPVRNIKLELQQQSVIIPLTMNLPVFDVQRRVNITKRTHTPPPSQKPRNIIEQDRMSKSSLKKLSLVKNIVPSSQDIISVKQKPQRSSLTMLTKHDRASSRDTYFRQDQYGEIRDRKCSQPKLADFQYNYDRILTKRFVSSESIISMSQSFRPKIARNILAQNSPEPIQTYPI